MQSHFQFNSAGLRGDEVKLRPLDHSALGVNYCKLQFRRQQLEACCTSARGTRATERRGWKRLPHQLALTLITLTSCVWVRVCAPGGVCVCSHWHFFLSAISIVHSFAKAEDAKDRWCYIQAWEHISYWCIKYKHGCWCTVHMPTSANELGKHLAKMQLFLE